MLGSFASAQDDDPFVDGDEADPLAVDRGDRLDTVTPTARDEVVRAPLPIVRGEALIAAAGVRETEHEVDVTLLDGLALVEVRMTFLSNARAPSEMHYRLAVPRDAAIAGLRVCRAAVCQEGAPDRAPTAMSAYDYVVQGGGPGDLAPIVAHAAPVTDARGTALMVRAAPLMPPERYGAGAVPLSVTVRYLVAAPVRGGHVRLTLPARGRDNRLVAASFRVRSDQLSGAAVAGRDAVESRVERAPWEDAEITATLDRRDVAMTAMEVRCGDARCVRLRAVAGTRAPVARDVILALDASPSMAGPASGRLAPTVASILSTLPSASRVRIVAFASRARVIGDGPVAPTELSVAALETARHTALGNATHFAAAWAAIAPMLDATREPLVLVVGDGGTTDSDENRAAFRAAARRAELVVINVADRPVTRALEEALAGLRVRVLEVGPEAERTTQGHGGDALAERFTALTAPGEERPITASLGNRRFSLGALRAGEELVFEARLAHRERARIGVTTASPASPTLADGLSGRLAWRVDQVTTRWVAVPEDVPTPNACEVATGGPGYRRVEVIDPVRCDRPPTPAVARAERASELGRDPLLDLMRQRLIPIARGCFRSERRGRANHQARAVLGFRLHDREVSHVQITGRVSEALRACLASSLESLEVPPFDGTITVHYPLYTEAHPPPPTLTLDAEVADAVDAVADPTPDR